MNAATLPQLKKRDKERKRTGAAWSWADGLNPWTGALGAAAACRLPASGQLIAAGLSSIAIGAGLWAYRAAPAAPARAALPSLGVPHSTIRARKPQRSESFENLSRAASGQITFEQPEPRAPAPHAAPASVAQSPRPISSQSTDWKEALKLGRSKVDRLAHDLSGAKLSSTLGAEFGRKNIFFNSTHASNLNTPALGQGLQRQGTARFASGLNGRSLSFQKPGVARRGLTQRAPKLGRSRRAIGQLSLARALSVAATKMSDPESSKTAAADAFEQRASVGGSAPQSPTDGAGSELGGGTVDPASLASSASSGDSLVETISEGTPVSDYQDVVDSALASASEAADMKTLSLLMLALGAALVAAGMAVGMPWGAALIAAGGALLAIGAMELTMAEELARAASAMSQTIQQTYGQEAQAQTLDACISQALSEGTKCDSSQYTSIELDGAAGEAAQEESRAAGETTLGD